MEVKINCPSGCETIHHKLNCGAEVYILPKERNIKVGAVAVSFGSADTEFYHENKYYRVPLGTAHFLEHQMFEQIDGNVSSKFTELGAEVNAFTDGGKTVYYFKTADNFMECFSLLLNFVETPYFMEDSVNNEKKIIKNEIAMYDDDPNWKAFFGALKNLYPDSSLSSEIAGTAESVDKINTEILYACHSAFYVPRNMTIICGGDVKADDIMNEAEKILGGMEKTPAQAKCLKTEIQGGSTELEMDVTVPRYCAVYPVEPNGCRIKKNFLLRMIGDTAFGESSKSFKKLISNGIASEVPQVEIYEHKGLGYFAVSGPAEDGQKAAALLDEALVEIKESGIDERTFVRERKKLTGWFMRSIDDCETAVMTQAEFRGRSLAEIAETLRSLTLNECEDVLDMIDTVNGVCVVNGKTD